MAHYCDIALVTCEDFRLHQRKHGRNIIADYVKELGCDCDIITRGGRKPASTSRCCATWKCR
jgi:hypothetical protein